MQILFIYFFDDYFECKFEKGQSNSFHKRTSLEIYDEIQQTTQELRKQFGLVMSNMKRKRK